MKTQIILAGIGGQGILFASRVFSELGLRLGLDVMGSEAHGMSQRGGPVIAHLKLGHFLSPVVREGAADILYSFEENETYRSLRFLRSDGVCFANFMSRDQFNRKIFNYLRDRGTLVFTYDANSAASKLGSVVSANIALISYSVGTGLVPFKYDDLEYVLKLVSRKKNLEINLKVFEEGFQAGKSFVENLDKQEGSTINNDEF